MEIALNDTMLNNLPSEPQSGFDPSNNANDKLNIESSIFEISDEKEKNLNEEHK